MNNQPNNNQNNTIKKFEIFKDKRVFERIGEALLLVVDVDTKITTTEEFEVVYNILKILLNENQLNKFLSCYSNGEKVIVDFVNNKVGVINFKNINKLGPIMMNKEKIFNQLENGENLEDKFQYI